MIFRLSRGPLRFHELWISSDMNDFLQFLFLPFWACGGGSWALGPSEPIGMYPPNIAIGG